MSNDPKGKRKWEKERTEEEEGTIIEAVPAALSFAPRKKILARLQLAGRCG